MEDGDIGNQLIAQDLHREFSTAEGILKVLQGVNLKVKKSEMVAIVGESGVGKSTLLHLLGGLDRPSSGKLEVGGEDFGSKNESARARYRNEHIGFVFQHHFLMEDFTALENCMIPALVADKSRSEAVLLAEQLLGDVGLKDRMTHLPNQLSGGEQQRVAVARALVNSPDLVMADEPSGNLDIKTGEKLHQLLYDLNKERGITFIIATHNKVLAQSCRRIEKLKDGLLTETTDY